MALTNFDDDQFEEVPPEGGADDLRDVESPEPQPGGNKTFVIVVGVIVGLFVLALAGLVLIAPRILADQKSAYIQQAAEINAANTATSVFATQNALAEQLALTPTATLEPTMAPEPSATPVLAQPTEEPTKEPIEPALGAEEAMQHTATVAALLTEMAGGTGGGAGTEVPTVAVTVIATATALPNTGLMDDLGQFGLAGTLGLAALLVVIIMVARRLRLSAH